MRIDNDQKRDCRFLTWDGGIYYCKVLKGEVKPEQLNDFEYSYFYNECISYPDPNDDAHWDESMPKRCTWKRVAK